LYLEGIAISLFMFVFLLPFKYNLVYIVPIVVANLMFFYVAVGYLSKDSRRFFDMSRNLSLLAMGIALISYLISAIFYIVV
jgi:hypothetical protein